MDLIGVPSSIARGASVRFNTRRVILKSVGSMCRLAMKIGGVMDGITG